MKEVTPTTYNTAISSRTQTPTLQRGIHKWDLVLMIINSIIGAGIFGLPSKIFALTGVYSILAFFVCAAVVLLFILCFAEVGSRFQSTGGPYTYTLEAFGKFPAFLVGWLLLLSRIFNYATLINLFVTYLAFFVPVASSSLVRAAIMVSLTCFIGYANHIGIKNTTRLSNILTVSKLVPLALFVLVGLFSINPGFFAQTQTPPAFSSFSNAVLLLVFAFGGFESVMVNTGEIRNPNKTIPFGLLTATLVVAVFYILIQIVCIGTLPNLSKSEKPLAEAAAGFIGNTGGILISVGALVSILGTLHVLILSGSRLPFAFSQEGQFPLKFSYVDPKRLTPTFSILLVVILSSFVSIAWSFLTALTVAVIIRVAVYFSVCASLLRLRKKERQTEFYKLPFGNVIAILGMAFSIWLLSASKLVELRNTAIFLSIGIAIYFLQRWSSLKRN
ncbi:MAG: amino acid permease [Chitinophagaceae bacterium]|nr:MAG: amino acid permease [Chitinophagaceae bacterium]